MYAAAMKVFLAREAELSVSRGTAGAEGLLTLVSAW